jgi:hypothetical protein
MLRLLLTSAASAVVFLALGACYEQSAGCAQEESDIVSTIPWADGEQLKYVILDNEGEDVLLTGDMSATLMGAEYELNLIFEDAEGQTDESTVMVDAETMKPSFVRREITCGEDRQLIEGEYEKDAEDGDDVLNITEIDQDGDERTLPLRLEEPYYDNESSLYLWRTVSFEAGYEADYNTVIAAQGVQHDVNVQVDGQEEVEINLGTFDAWYMEIRSESRTQRLWFSDSPERFLLQYDNSRGQLFQLAELPAGLTPKSAPDAP